MKIGLIIIGHVESTRLKHKMLLPLGGQTFLEQVFDQAKKNKDMPIIFATTMNQADDVLVQLAEQKGLPVFRGAETDILKRYHDAVKSYKLDALITWDGDDLFVDPRCVEQTKRLLEEGADYVKPDALPYGTFCYGISATALKKIIELKADDETEGWARYFTQIPGFKISSYTLPAHENLNIRLTLDYPEDYELIKKVFAFWQSTAPQTQPLEAIKEFIKQFPQDCRLNENRVNEYEKRFREKYSTIKLRKTKL